MIVAENVKAKLLLTILGLLVLAPEAFSQDGTMYRHNVGFTALKGLIVPQYEHGRHLTYGRPSGFELFYNHQSRGEKEREVILGLPQNGFSLTYIDTDMEETGYIVNGAAYLDFFFVRKRKFRSFFRLGAGLTYASKIYDPVDNNLNNILSSRISYHALVRLGTMINLSEQWLLTPAVSWNHTSNGSSSLPNNGLNIASFNLGVAYQFAPSERVSEEQMEPALVDEGFGYSLLISGAAKQSEPMGNPKRLYMTVRGTMDWSINKVSRLFWGVELFNDRTILDDIRREGGDPKNIDHRRIGLLIGHEFRISRASFISAIGYYVYKPFDGELDDDPAIYNRLGLQYYFHKNFFATAMMKNHWAQADVFDFGLGVRL
ncbi:MAG: acyloxyacyl hydrolase [Bacteroidota bacterium]